FSKEDITEEELEKMKSQDMIDSMLQEFTNSFPKLKEPLIDERDQFLSQKIKSAPGKKIVAVLGAAHVPRSEERRVGKRARSKRDWSSDVCSSDLFSKEDITEEELEKMKSQDMIDSMLQEFTNSFPKLKEPLIDERDQFLSQKIKSAPGKKIVAVLGAAHVP